MTSQGMGFDNRVTRLLGCELPIVQAPMGWIARSQLASAVSNAGGMGIIETSSGELDIVKDEIRKMRDLTDKPFGVNIAQAFVRDPNIVEFVINQGVRFVTTSAGDPTKYTGALKAAGLTVFHVVPTLAGALKAVDAGVDGLVVEGGEGGGFKNPRDVASMVLLPLVRSKVAVPIIAAGGIVDGPSMAAAFALGAEGVQMGTRMVSALESPVHQNWKDAIVGAAETDTVFLNRHSKPGLRALRTERTTRLEREDAVSMAEFGTATDLYFGGDMEASIALGGQVMGRIDEVKPVAQILNETVEGFLATINGLARSYAGAPAPMPGLSLLLAQLEIRHSRAVVPTRRVALGDLWLPTTPPPGNGGLLLAAVVGRAVAELDEEMRDDLETLIDDLQRHRRIAQPRLRHRFQTDVVGLDRSTHRLVRVGCRAVLEYDDHGAPIVQGLGAVYAAGHLSMRSRPHVFRLVRRATRWEGGPTADLLDFLTSGEATSSRWGHGHDERWALKVLGFRPETEPARHEILGRFRQLVRDVHPDHGAEIDGAGQRVQELAEAKRILLS